MMLSIARKNLKKSLPRTWILRIAGYLFAAYGILAFVRRDVGNYLLLRSHFVFFDYSESVAFFLVDYLSVMALFVMIGYWAMIVIKRKRLRIK